MNAWPSNVVAAAAATRPVKANFDEKRIRLSKAIPGLMKLRAAAFIDAPFLGGNPPGRSVVNHEIRGDDLLSAPILQYFPRSFRHLVEMSVIFTVKKHETSFMIKWFIGKNSNDARLIRPNFPKNSA